jgi:hypothetical protein
LITLVVLAAHATALGNGFIFDDFAAHRDSPALRTTAGLVHLLTDARVLPDTNPAGPVFRPVAGALDWLSWQIARSSPLAHHSIDVALHAVACVLLFRLVAQAGAPRAAPLLALLFGVHPLTTGAVAALAGRPVLLGAVALLYTARRVAWTRHPALAGLVAAVGAVLAVGSHEAYVLAAPLVIATGIPERRRVLWVLPAAAAAGAGVVLLGPGRVLGSELGASLGMSAALLGRFGAELLVPRPPVLSFTPSPWTAGAAAGAVAALALLAAAVARSLHGPLRRLWVAGVGLGLGVPLALGPAALAARSCADRPAYAVLLGVALMAAALAGRLPETIVARAPAVSVLGLAAFVPLDAAYALDMSDEITVLKRAAERDDEEGRLARAMHEPNRLAVLPFCTEYARSHGPATRADGCVALGLIAAGETERALEHAWVYFRERPNRRWARAVLVEALFAAGRLSEARALAERWERAAVEAMPGRAGSGAP